MLEEIQRINDQFRTNKSAVLKKLIESITDVKMEVPAVVKSNFGHKADLWEDDAGIL